MLKSLGISTTKKAVDLNYKPTAEIKKSTFFVGTMIFLDDLSSQQQAIFRFSSTKQRNQKQKKQNRKVINNKLEGLYKSVNQNHGTSNPQPITFNPQLLTYN